MALFCCNNNTMTHYIIVHMTDAKHTLIAVVNTWEDIMHKEFESMKIKTKKSKTLPQITNISNVMYFILLRKLTGAFERCLKWLSCSRDQRRIWCLTWRLPHICEVCWLYQTVKLNGLNFSMGPVTLCPWIHMFPTSIMWLKSPTFVKCKPDPELHRAY